VTRLFSPRASSPDPYDEGLLPQMGRRMGRLSSTRSLDDRTTAVLLRRGKVTFAQVQEAVAASRRWDMPVGDVLVAQGRVRAQELYDAVAAATGLPHVDLMRNPPDRELLDPTMVQEYAVNLCIPWRRRGDSIVVATSIPSPETILYIRRTWGRSVELVVTSKFDVIWTLQREFESAFTHRALSDLHDRDPTSSARNVFTVPQLLFVYLLASMLVIGLAADAVTTLVAANILISTFFIGNFVLKLILVWIGGRSDRGPWVVSPAETAALQDEDLPVFSVLVPMFREPETLPILANALRRLDYPKAKLDIKLVLEEGDHVTIDAAKALGLESIFEIIRVPPSQPQTKPKACNYALHFCRGEFVTIFDAEDKPEPDQLKKALVAFRKAGPRTAVIQARLNYYNARENWLTRMFTLDYSLWFDLMLPGLFQLGIPIPLGGTSNHFRTDVLRELGAWDPYNVTEDADLGLRLTMHGYHVGLVASTTFEEANCHIGNWIRQRSRWFKGYMQTYLVHMRDPLVLYRALGHKGFWGFQAFIGGTIVAGLFNPVFWFLYIAWVVTQTSTLDLYFPPVLLYVSLFNLLIGNSAFIFLTMIGPLRRGWNDLAGWAVTTFAYWVLMSISAYKALWQLVFSPFYWEKTQHGLSRLMGAELEAARREEAP